MHIIRAKPSEAATLSAIAWAAKAFWNYPSDWMEQWREQLTITPIFIAENEAFAAVINRQTIAFHALLKRADVLRLEHLWVLPDFMGRPRLFRHAAERAAARGALSLTIEADDAEPFFAAWVVRAARSRPKSTVAPDLPLTFLPKLQPD